MRPDDLTLASGPRPAEVADDMAETIADAMLRLRPETLRRLLAFMHLIEDHERVTAVIETGAGGAMRLLLSHAASISKPS